MPDRIIRDEILTSERYWAVSIEAQRLFIHLLLNADALARFSGKNFTIRMSCYPGHAIEPKRIEKMLAELQDVDLIRLYEVSGDRYIFIPRYRQRLRYTNSEFPEPPKEINDILLEKSGASQARVRPAPLEVKRSEVNPSATDVAMQAVCREVWKAYVSGYAFRYGADPIRNARVNSQIKQFCKLIPHEEAPAVAQFYTAHSQQGYVRANHPVSLLLRDAEALRTQWMTGRSVTETQARLADKTAANKDTFSQLINEAREREKTGK